jgi:RHS repeat-associated protein
MSPAATPSTARILAVLSPARGCPPLSAPHPSMPHMPRRRSPATRLLPALAALLFAAALPTEAAAQCVRQPDGSYLCDTGEGPGGNAPPSVTISPAGAAVSQPEIPVTIRMFDDSGLRQGSFKVLLGTEDVTGRFSYTYTYVSDPTVVDRYQATAVGSLVLPATGAPQLLATVCDGAAAEECGTDFASFSISRAGVEVTPKFETVETSPTGSATQSFTVRNAGTESGTFSLAASCRDELSAAVACSVSQPQLPLAAGQSAAVVVTYGAARTGSVVSVTLTASRAGAPGVQDAGWIDAEVTGTAGTQPRAPTARAVPLTSGAAVARSRCVTVATALRGAFECGDLRVAHGLPAHHTRGRTWAPALLYNSQHAQPRPTVYADVTLPADAAPPSTVEMVVTMADGATHRASFAGATFRAGLTRRIGVQWDALNTSTGLYRYKLQVTSHYSGGSFASVPDSGEVAIVNRSGSGFGAGWWPAGVEQLLCVNCATGSRTLWVGGDGSTRVYEPVSPGAWTTWVSQNPGGRPDTLVLSGGVYTRKLPGGGTVYYDDVGRHTMTVNRLGQATRITHGANGPTGIYVPGSGPGGPGTGDPAWIFNWDAGTQLVRSISATAHGAPTRTVTLSADGSRRVTAITDPDSGAVWFGYSESSTPRRIMGQRDRRGTWTWYGYDAAGKLAIARTYLTSTPNDAADPTTLFAAAESRGVAFEGATGATPVNPLQVSTQIVSPRKDVSANTFLWLTPGGTVRRVRDPLGAETRVQFGDARFPVLPTQVTSASGQVSRAHYDARGRVDTMTVVNPLGDGRDQATVYAYDDRWDAPTAVTSYDVSAGAWTPVAGTARAAYDALTGNVLWRQQGDDQARRVNFTYYTSGAAAGLPASVRAPSSVPGMTARDSLVYDARGNLRKTVSPLGFLTLHMRDALGRDSMVYTPVAEATARDSIQIVNYGAGQAFWYDRMGRVVQTASYGAQISQVPASVGGAPSVGPGITPAEQLRVVTTYDAEGAPLTVTRTIDPNPAGLEPQVTTYVYDGMGRKTEERNGVMRTQYGYDPAGNVTSVTTPRGAQVTSRYDAAGRLLQRTVPAATYAATSGSCGTMPVFDPYAPTCNTAKFPFFPNEGTGYRVPAEWTTYRYDVSGNLVHAENADAVVRRTYYPGGQLRTDSSFIRDFRDGYPQQAFGIEYRYQAGRLSQLLHPRNLAGTSFIDKFSYDPVTGALSMAEDRLGNLFTFTYDFAGALTRTNLPGGITDTATYDVAGRMVWRRERSPAHVEHLQEETYTHDARNKLVAATVRPSLGRSTESTFWNWYSGLGSLVMTHWANSTDAQFQREGFLTDPLGNVVRRRSYLTDAEGPGMDNPDFQNTLDRAHGRVTLISLVDETTGTATDNTINHYDASGNLEAWYQRASAAGSWTRLVDGRSWYGADDRLRALQKYDVVPTTIQGKSSGLFEEYRYDPMGRRVAVRTRQPSTLCNQSPQCFNSTTYFVWAGDDLLWEIKQAESPAPQEAGGTVSYFQAGGIDRPLVIWKQGVGSIVTHQNWRGQFARGTWGEGTGRVGQSSDCTGTYPQQTPCVPVRWPGWNTGAWNAEAAKPSTVGSERYWMGSQAVGMRDASGQMYMRNRYYNPQTGQFTQPDPIGLAGGLNSYGFAAGDPVTYSDPYGLCPGIPDTNQLDPTDCPPGYFTLIGTVLGGAGGALVGGVAGLVCLETGPGVIVCVAAGAAGGAEAGAAAGGLVGSAIDVGMGLLRMARAGRGGGNSAENRGSNYFIQKHNLNRAGQQELHRRLGRLKKAGEEITDETLDDVAADVANHSKWVLEP